MRSSDVHVDEVSATSNRSGDDGFWDLYMPEPNCGCWLWLGEMSKEQPCVKVGEVMRMADELFYERRFGSIDATHALQHSCGLECCVNPDHMIAISSKSTGE